MGGKPGNCGIFTNRYMRSIDQARWKMFGKILRQSENKPSQSAIIFAIGPASKLKSRRGRPTITLLVPLKSDTRERNMRILKKIH